MICTLLLTYLGEVSGCFSELLVYYPKYPHAADG